MGRIILRTFTLKLMLSCLFVSYGLVIEQSGLHRGMAFASDTSLKIESLPKDPRAYRLQVDQILTKVDALLAKMRVDPKAMPIVMDLVQTRDNVVREIMKVEVTPDGSKWTLDEGRASVDAMLKLMKEQYDKASQIGSEVK